MNGPTNMFELLQAGERLSERNDRTAFFVALFVLGAFGFLVLKTALGFLKEMKAQNATQFSELKEMALELKAVVVNNTSTVETCRVQLGRNSDLLEEFGGANNKPHFRNQRP